MSYRIKINAEQRFRPNVKTFALGFSGSGYTLMYSADGVNYTPWDTPTPANTTQVVTNAALGMAFYLLGNTGEVTVNW